MFRSARIKLTLYYLAIIASIMFVLSFLAYRGFVYEFLRGLRVRKGIVVLNIPPPVGMFVAPTVIDEPTAAEIFEEARKRVILNLIFLNTAILSAAGFAGYFLAGKTLAPIEAMVEEQKRFISDASHELRTPLAAIKSEIEIGLKDKSTTFADAKKLLKSNLEEVDKMQELANNLLVLNKHQNVGMNSSLRVNLKTLVLDAIKKTQFKADEKGVKIEKEIKSIYVLGDKTSLEELAVIIIDNAIKYNKKRGIVRVKVGRLRRKAVFEVSDSGLGIKRMDLPYIFDRFYRSDSSRNKTVGGYGLGLSIAKSIVERNAGEIQVRSKFNKGTTFIVKLPTAN